MGRYIVQADLEDRVSAQVLREITDDDVDETPDATVLARVIADAESTVESFLRKVYNLQALRDLAGADIDDVPNEIKRLCLDLAVAYLWDRFPEYVRADGRRMRQDALDELRDLARGLRRLDDIDTVEPTAQVTVQARSGDPDDPDPADKFFMNPGSFGVY